MRLNFSMTLVSYTVSVFTVTKLQKCTTVNLNIKSGRELTADMASPLWTIYAATYGSALYHCFPRCEEDERCVGIELCRIRPDYSRCRGCCEWFVNWHKGIALTTSDKCRYIELVCILAVFSKIKYWFFLTILNWNFLTKLSYLYKWRLLLFDVRQIEYLFISLIWY